MASCVVSTQHRGTLVAPGIPNSLCACLLEIRQVNPRRAQNMGTSWQFSPRKGPLFSTHVPSSRPLSPSAFPLQQPLYQLPGPTPRAPAARATWEQVIHPPLLLILCGFLVWLTGEPGGPTHWPCLSWQPWLPAAPDLRLSIGNRPRAMALAAASRGSPFPPLFPCLPLLLHQPSAETSLTPSTSRLLFTSPPSSSASATVCD